MPSSSANSNSINSRSGSGCSSTTSHKQMVCVSMIPTRDKVLSTVLLNDLKHVARAVKSSIENLAFEKLDFGQVDVITKFYNADVVFVEMSDSSQHVSLFYHLGVRVNFSARENIILYKRSGSDDAAAVKASCVHAGYSFLPYSLNPSGNYCEIDSSMMFIPENFRTNASRHYSGQRLSMKLQHILLDIQQITTINAKELFVADLNKARDELSGDAYKKELSRMKKRLDNPSLISVDTVYNLLIGYREIQDYPTMISVIESIEDASLPTNKITSVGVITHLYAFALNRRNAAGDRDKALARIEQALEKTENYFPDMLCMCGRIYKDKFVESHGKDNDSLQNAIKWYRKGFEIYPNEYAGINLATLLMISGEDMSTSKELQNMALNLTTLITRRGKLENQTDYWSVATFFEIGVLSNKHARAIDAARVMFRLHPPAWYLKSTLGNIKLIAEYRKSTECGSPYSRSNNIQVPNAETLHYEFWLEFFVEATTECVDEKTIAPVLILEQTSIQSDETGSSLVDGMSQTRIFSKNYTPSYISIDSDAELISIWHVIHNSSSYHQWKFDSSTVRTASRCDSDDRCMFLFVWANFDSFQLYFPSAKYRQRFFEQIKLMMSSSGMESSFAESLEQTEQEIKFEYERDSRGDKKRLGQGGYGTVYQAIDLDTHATIAIKEVIERCPGELQALHEEIRLHKHLNHRNIVKYLGSCNEDGVFKIFMECVPGGSLASLIRYQWGPLKDNDTLVSNYTRQILEGLKYLHDQGIVHRDIKGDNILVNTYTGVLKIADFGTSKRLAGITPVAKTLAGTVQFLAPEVINHGYRGYGKSADIWSLGCTVVEMVNGKPPFNEMDRNQTYWKLGNKLCHPEIPSCVTDLCADFMLKCFIFEPEERPTSQQLLEHSWVFKPKPGIKQSMSTQNISNRDYMRSTSAPVDTEAKLDVEPQSKLASAEVNPTSRDPFSSFMESKPAVRRRNKSGDPFKIPLPPYPEGTSSAESPNVNATFYVVKQEGERRGFTIQILNQEKSKVIERWSSVMNEQGTLYVAQEDFQILIEAVITNIDFDNEAVDQMKRKLRIHYGRRRYPLSAINDSENALWALPNILIENLRKQIEEPHWMFTIEGIVKDSVNAMISFLQVLKSNCRSHDRPLSTVISESSISSEDAEISISGASSMPQKRPSSREVEILAADNTRLMEYLVNHERLVKQILEISLSNAEQLMRFNMSDRMSRNFSNHPLPRLDESNVSRLYSSCDINIPSYTTGPPAYNFPDGNDYSISPTADAMLVQWLRQRGFNNRTISQFVKEEFTLHDVQTSLTREDLRSMNLSLGVQCRIWQHITDERHQ